MSFLSLLAEKPIVREMTETSKENEKLNGQWNSVSWLNISFSVLDNAIYFSLIRHYQTE